MKVSIETEPRTSITEVFINEKGLTKLEAYIQETARLKDYLQEILSRRDFHTLVAANILRQIGKINLLPKIYSDFTQQLREGGDVTARFFVYMDNPQVVLSPNTRLWGGTIPRDDFEILLEVLRSDDTIDSRQDGCLTLKEIPLIKNALYDGQEVIFKSGINAGQTK